MPELPEVETIRRNLTPLLEGRCIHHVQVLLPRIVKWPEIEIFSAYLKNKKIMKVNRRGKYLLLEMEDDRVLVVHLRMTGRLFHGTPGTQDRFVRIMFMLDSGNILYYSDSRTLGTIYLLPGEELWRINGLANMGPEPFDEKFSLDYLSYGLAKRKGKIKSLLLDQAFIGGLGNIYADEALAVAGIHPERKANSFTEAETERLYYGIRQVIEEGLLHGGTTLRDYRDGAGNKGNHQNHLRVYGQTGNPCSVCGMMVSRIEVGGRGTHFCSRCQK